MKKIILFNLLLLITLSGCSRIIKNLDSPAWDPPTEFQQAILLPPLEVAPALTKTQSAQSLKSSKNP